MNFKLLLTTILSFLLAITSCSKKTNIESVNDKQSYISEIEKLSDTDRKEILEKEIHRIEQTLATCEDWSTYYGFASANSGDLSIGIKDEDDPANPFMIFSAKDYINDFQAINKNNLIATQKITKSNSNFDFYISQSPFNVINNSDLKYTVKEVFTNGNRSNTLTNTLLPADSLDVEVSYTYPTAFDSITIKKGIKSIVYNKDTINVDYNSDKEVDLYMPTDLNIIGYRASDTHGILMSEDMYANYPVTSFSASIITQIKEGLVLFNKALKTNDKAQSIAYLKEIPSDTFDKITLMFAFSNDLEELGKKEESSEDTGFKEMLNIVSGLEWLIKKYDSILVKSSKNINISFPRPITKIYLYVATQHQKYDTSFVVETVKDYIFPYNIFTDSTETKYGISDDKGQVIIPATYSNIYRSDTLYFRITENDSEFSAYLNPETKKLEALPKDLTIIKKLNNNLLSFSNKENKIGVLKNLKEEIIPFKYNNIYIVGKTIIAEASKRGRKYYEFYSLDGKLLDMGSVDDVDYSEKSNSGIIIVSKNNRYGFINKEGVMTISPRYRNLKFISDNLLKYQTDRSIEYGYLKDRKYLSGIVGNDGKEISEPIYYEIDPLHEDRAIVRVYIDDGDYNKYVLSGFIDEKGKEVIKPQYEEVEDFDNGYATVGIDNDYKQIDKAGNVVTIFKKLGCYIGGKNK